MANRPRPQKEVVCSNSNVRAAGGTKLASGERAGWRIEPRTQASYLTLSLDQPVGLGSGMVQLPVFGAHEDDRYTFHYVGIYVGK